MIFVFDVSCIILFLFLCYSLLFYLFFRYVHVEVAELLTKWCKSYFMFNDVWRVFYIVMRPFRGCCFFISYKQSLYGMLYIQSQSPCITVPILLQNNCCLLVAFAVGGWKGAFLIFVKISCLFISNVFPCAHFGKCWTILH